MKTLFAQRAGGTEYERIAVNLTGKPLESTDCQYIAEPNGPVASLRATHVRLYADWNSRDRLRKAIDRTLAVGVLSLAIVFEQETIWIFNKFGDGKFVDDFSVELGVEAQKTFDYLSAGVKK